MVASSRDPFRKKMEGAMMKLADAVEKSREAILRRVHISPMDPS